MLFIYTETGQMSGLTFPSLAMFRYKERGSVNKMVVSMITKRRSASGWPGPTANTGWEVAQ